MFNKPNFFFRFSFKEFSNLFKSILSIKKWILYSELFGFRIPNQIWIPIKFCWILDSVTWVEKLVVVALAS